MGFHTEFLVGVGKMMRVEPCPLRVYGVCSPRKFSCSEVPPPLYETPMGVLHQFSAFSLIHT